MTACHAPLARQRGVAALVVVLVLFLVVSLVAAYTSRNLIFEQRTATNQYRSTQALEAAEAGLEWTIAMLNEGRVDTACGVDASGATSFRQRYIAMDGQAGMIVPQTTITGDHLFASCILDGGQWKCQCTMTTPPGLPTTTQAGPHPAFRVGFTGTTAQPGVIRAHVIGCTVAQESCLAFSPTMGAAGEPINQAVAPGNEGVAAITAWLGLAGHLAAVEREPGPSRAVITVLPRDAVTAQRDIGRTGAGTLSVVRAGSGAGFVARAGRTIDAAAIVATAQPGTPAGGAMLPNDSALQEIGVTPPGLVDGDRMFASVFNVMPAAFKEQPATVLMTTCNPCTASQLKARVAANPGRPIWIEGSLVIDEAGAIGSVDWPALVVVTGDVSFSVGGAPFFGLLYGRTQTWTITGTPDVHGAVVAEKDLVLATTGGSVVYDPAPLTRLNTRTGSFVRVPGGWKDFP